MIISKNENWFIIENKEKNTVSFNSKIKSDLNIFSFEKNDQNKIYFDQEWEYEAFWIEVTGFDLWENLNTGFIIKTDWKKVFLLDWKVSWFNEKVFSKIDEVDVLAVNIPEKFNNIDLVKTIIEKSSAKIVVFSWDKEKIINKFEKLEDWDLKLSIWANPDTTIFYYL